MSIIFLCTRIWFDLSESVHNPPNVNFWNQKAGDLYYSLTGNRIENNTIVNPGIADIKNKNSNLFYKVEIGGLGDRLRSYGVSKVVIGNSDTAISRRFAPILITDNMGRVPSGYIGSATTIDDVEFPNGFRSNYDWILNKTLDSLKNNSLVVVELGDLSRIEETMNLMTTQRYDNLRDKSLERIDDFVGNLKSKIDLNVTQLIILAPTPSQLDLKENNFLTPLVISGVNFQKGGLLTSASTRREGIIANTDVAPTILSYYGITKLSNMVGRTITSVESTNSLDHLNNLTSRLMLTYTQRPILLKTTAVLEIITIISSVFIIRFDSGRRWSKLFQRLAVVFLWIPLVMLYYRFLQLNSLFYSFIIIIVITTIVIYIVEYRKIVSPMVFAVFSILTSLTIVADILGKFNLITTSPLGFDPMLGGRYYGIGNEYSGVLMGSTLLGISSILQVTQQSTKRKIFLYVAGVYLLVVFLLLLSPVLGADAGGVITSMGSFVYFWMIINHKKFTPQKVLLLIIGILAVLLAGARLDQTVNKLGESHFGLAMGQIIQGGWQEALLIVKRKILMNWKLMRYSIWSDVLLAAIAGLTFLMYYPKGIFKKLEVQDKYVYKGIKATIVASIIGFLVNDSGVVQAATTSIYIIFPLIYLVFKEQLKLLIHGSENND